MSLARNRLSFLSQFLRTHTLSRTIIGLLTLAIVLLLSVNITTFVMIQRTAAFNDRIEQTQDIRRTARSLLIAVIDAETGQRGFLLTGQASFLAPYRETQVEIPALASALRRATASDPALIGRAGAIEQLVEAKLEEMDSNLDLARSGRIGQAVQGVRSGRGKALMDAIRENITELDRVVSERVVARTDESERSSIVTALVNAVAGILILVLAGFTLILVRRYVTDLMEARGTLDRLNAGLEKTIKDRTAALTRANEEVQRFAYIVSHDLRAPLVNIMGYTSELEQAGVIIDRQVSRLETLAPDLVESDAVTAVREDVPEAVGFIRASTEKMDRLINAILKLSREGRRNLTPETLDMTAMMTGIADSVNHQTEAADAEIVVEDLPSFESDRLSIEQIMSNLIDNAVKYLDSKRTGRIVVSGTDVAGGWVEYAIADNGRGISDKDHERIFELFRRSGRQDTRGEGLGLAFVRNSVRRLGGTITVESTLGEGSTFRVKFPKRLIVAEGEDAA